ncbi:hypothetical protein HU200_054134 [Digitaria exilis]|uniref:F-box protein n=1 Tax=Digitaria exilis TaxID=1010633 RepID=A0A835E4G2_9POAL|nr:hypothetical protein HU200_054134 [Digitaria exilis]
MPAAFAATAASLPTIQSLPPLIWSESCVPRLRTASPFTSRKEHRRRGGLLGTRRQRRRGGRNACLQGSRGGGQQAPLPGGAPPPPSPRCVTREQNRRTAGGLCSGAGARDAGGGRPSCLAPPTRIRPLPLPPATATGASPEREQKGKKFEMGRCGWHICPLHRDLNPPSSSPSSPPASPFPSPPPPPPPPPEPSMPGAFHSLLLPLHRKRKSKRRRTRNHHLAGVGGGGEPSFHLKGSTSSASSHDVGCLVQPLGNLLLASSPRANLRDAGLGALRPLPDELLLDVLGLLTARDLAALSVASKALYVVAAHDPLWRALVFDELGGAFDFAGSWRATYISAASRGQHHLVPPRALRIKGFYSDYLFQSWLCANMEMRHEWLARDNIERRRGMSVEQFIAEVEEPNRPVLLEGCIDGWPALQKWSREYLLEISAGKEFAVGPVTMTLERYFRYADNVQEERPLYLFDAKFAEKVPEMGKDYEVPVYFREDLFNVLGEERPDYRWVIIGPAGSGSSFHVDPNSTSAWNAIIKGAKKWVMFPPEVVPPGVHPSADGAEKPNASELVSGTKDRVNLHDKFCDAIEAAHTGMINQLKLEAQQKATARKKKASFWDSAVDAKSGGFKFSF